MSMVRFATLCDKCGQRSDEYSAWPSCLECMEDFCPNCGSVTVEADVDQPERGICNACAKELDDPPCECVRIDVDLDDNRYCPAHGPRSPGARLQRQQEADEEAMAAARIPYLLGEDWSDKR